MRYEQKAELQDGNKARIYAEKKNKHNVLIAKLEVANDIERTMTEIYDLEKKAIREEILSILEDYHYESDTENMSKDVVVALENLVKSRLLSEVNAEHKKKEDEMIKNWKDEIAINKGGQ